MKNVKRLSAFVLAAVFICMAFTSCGGGAKKYTIGICQLMKHDALDAATQGFIDAVNQELGEENVDIDTQIAGEAPVCATIVNTFVSRKVDLIMANATDALQSAMQATKDIPIVATSITSYGVAMDVEDFSGKTGINVTGTSDLAPLDQQAAMIKEICPDTKTVGIIYCSSEANSLYQVQEITKELKELGITASPYSFSDAADLRPVVEKAISDNDVLYVPTDNTAANSTGIIDGVARPKKVPVFSGEEGICKGCGIVTLTIKYYDIGFQAGKMAAEILRDGKNPGDMEIAFAPQFTKEYNKEICEELGITVPSDYVAIGD